jgi:hypothetical protein
LFDPTHALDGSALRSILSLIGQTPSIDAGIQGVRNFTGAVGVNAGDKSPEKRDLKSPLKRA